MKMVQELILIKIAVEHHPVMEECCCLAACVSCVSGSDWKGNAATKVNWAPAQQRGPTPESHSGREANLLRLHTGSRRELSGCHELPAWQLRPGEDPNFKSPLLFDCFVITAFVCLCWLFSLLSLRSRCWKTGCSTLRERLLSSNSLQTHLIESVRPQPNPLPLLRLLHPKHKLW